MVPEKAEDGGWRGMTWEEIENVMAECTRSGIYLFVKNLCAGCRRNIDDWLGAKSRRNKNGRLSRDSRPEQGSIQVQAYLDAMARHRSVCLLTNVARFEIN